MTDYRIQGPQEAKDIVRAHAPCETAPNATGSVCTCSYACANWWLRCRGYKGEHAREEHAGWGEEL
jgi:hypothetical protein